MEFIGPRKRYSNIAQRIFAIGVTIFGIIVLVQSYYLSGRAMDWRISAGVSALSFAVLFVNSHLPRRPVILIYKPNELVISGLLALGVAAIMQSSSVESEWGQSILLETGIACIFLSAVDLLLEAILENIKKRELEERQFWDEAALHIGFVRNLSLYAYWWMREFLDEVPAADIPTDAERYRVLMRYAQKAADLPDRFKVFEDKEFKAKLDHDLRVLQVVAGYAELLNLTDDEFHYLRAVAGMKADPDWTQDEPLTDKTLVTWIEHAAGQIVQNRRKGLKKLLSWSTPYDPLDALAEVERYFHERLGSKPPPPNLDRTAYEGDDFLDV